MGPTFFKCFLFHTSEMTDVQIRRVNSSKFNDDYQKPRVSQTCSFSCRIWTQSSNNSSSGAHKSASRRHLDRFGRFCTAHSCAEHTDRHTDHARCTMMAAAGVCNEPNERTAIVHCHPLTDSLMAHTADVTRPTDRCTHTTTVLRRSQPLAELSSTFALIMPRNRLI